MMLTNIRKPEALDLNYILDIDLKCFEDSWSYDIWKSILNDPQYGVLVGTIQGLPVGFIIWWADDDGGVVKRLGVKPAYKNQSVGSQLLSAVEVILKQQGGRRLQLQVTESLCRPDAVFNLSGWLKSRGYSATKLSRGSGCYCGETEDEITFCKILMEIVKHDQKLSNV